VENAPLTIFKGRKILYILVALSFLIFMGCVAFILYGNQKTYSTEVPISRIKDFKITEVAQLTGQESGNKTEDVFDVAGTDLGSLFEMNGKMYYVFGDTFGAGSHFPPGSGSTTHWRSNVIGYSVDRDPSNGIHLDGFMQDSSGRAKELIPSNKVNGDHLTSIPTYGAAVNQKMYLYYMAVNKWGAPGHWETDHSGVYASSDQGETWNPVEDLKWGADSNFAQVAIVKPEQNKEVLGKDIYFYGVMAGRYSSIKLMKVNEQHIEDKSNYLYFIGVQEKGRPQWSSDERQAVDILNTTAGELSVVWNPYLKRWLMTYINGSTTNIDIVEAENPWGPWSEPKQLVLQREFPGLYGSYMHPSFIRNEGTSIYFIMSRWFTYNAYVMKAELKVNNGLD
jgi:hypothetical protein